MKTFDSCRLPAEWFGGPVSDAAEALDLALYRLRRETLPVWKRAKRYVVRDCVTALRDEIAISNSAAAQRLRHIIRRTA